MTLTFGIIASSLIPTIQYVGKLCVTCPQVVIGACGWYLVTTASVQLPWYLAKGGLSTMRFIGTSAVDLVSKTKSLSQYNDHPIALTPVFVTEEDLHDNNTYMEDGLILHHYSSVNS